MVHSTIAQYSLHSTCDKETLDMLLIDSTWNDESLRFNRGRSLLSWIERLLILEGVATMGPDDF